MVWCDIYIGVRIPSSEGSQLSSAFPSLLIWPKSIVDYVSMSAMLEEEVEENEIIKKWNADKLDGWMDGWMDNRLSLSSHYILLNVSQDHERSALLASLTNESPEILNMLTELLKPLFHQPTSYSLFPITLFHIHSAPATPGTCCSSNVSGKLPQGFCAYSSICLQCSSTEYPHAYFFA